ncbi:MAG TPA: polysaccharide pyruvyl transferase CsaB [Oculatellaceae cyanobacterium]
MPVLSRELVVISGYYGFNNLGDEAILEQITTELKEIISADNIVVLSNNPQRTASRYGVKSVSRWRLASLVKLLPQTKLFVSGGGGLFQDVTSMKPPLFYGGQIFLAKLYGAKIMVFAQGIGPLKSGLSNFVTKTSMWCAHALTVRDSDSCTLLKKWGINAALTADPVWRLQSSPLPQGLDTQFRKMFANRPGLLVGLSLRESKNFQLDHMDALLNAMAEALPNDAEVLLLPLQREQDAQPLEDFRKRWEARGRKAQAMSLTDLEKPSQWLNLLGRLDLLVGMRLHAIIMALKSRVPVAGISYDPKVERVLREFEQPVLNLENTENGSLQREWENSLKLAVAERTALAKHAGVKSEAAKNLARQNFQALAKILNKEVPQE